VQSIYRASVQYAQTAESVARCSGRCDPENARAAGMLTPLGWIAAAAVYPRQAAEYLENPRLAAEAAVVQEKLWGLDQAAIARRLLRRWHLPRWLTLAVGHLGLPVELAQSLGADPDFFRVIQLAVSLVQQQGGGLHLAVGTGPAENATALGLTAREQEGISSPPEKIAAALWQPPQDNPFLVELLGLAVENLRLRQAPLLEQVEKDQDELQRALESQRSAEADRLQTLKLTALAEFAAGASHEINNPLAVISGQAQYLLGREMDTGRQRALQTIISQTQRIHQVLNGLMQFARPPKPQRQTVDLRPLLHEVALNMGELAAERQVQLVCPDSDPSITIYADPRQIRTALECLLRNALEAAPAGGWASLRLEALTPQQVELVVEDSGSGPAPAQRDHLFDPFFSGRQAGRGRGLGLPTAWRLAREHGGDVFLDERTSGPTRFVLRLPRGTAAVGGPETAEQKNGAESRPEFQTTPTNGCH
jgi:signal transduction histidine kinase